MNIDINSLPFIQEIVDVANETGATVYLVGGAVRDIILENEVTDFDYVVFNYDYMLFASKLGESLKAYLSDFKDNCRLMKNGVTIDITKPRGLSLDIDRELRDFTINNLASDLNGNIIGDTKHIDQKIISVVGKNSFKDDPLRIMRAFRCLATLNDFHIDEETYLLIDKNKQLLKGVPGERINIELQKILKEKKLNKSNFLALSLLKKYSILENFLGLNSCLAFNINALTKVNIHRYFLYLAVLFHNPHESSGLQLIKSLKLSKKQYKYITKIWSYYKLSDKDKVNGIIIWQNYDIMPLVIDFLEASSQSFDNLPKLIKAELALLSGLNRERGLLIDGNSLIELGLAVNKQFGYKLAGYQVRFAKDTTTKEQFMENIKNEIC